MISVVLGDGDIEVAHDALVLLKLQMSPLAVVDELFECLLQIVEHALLRARNLGMVDGNLGLQLLCCSLDRATAEETARR